LKRRNAWNKAKETEEPSKIASGAEFFFALLALEAYNRAIDLQPTNVDAWKGMGEAQAAMGLAASASSSRYVARALSSNIMVAVS
jgi:hypothetical protein